MAILEQFLAYAADFELTVVDDDWSRLRRYFAADAVYEVQSARFGCRLAGPTAIFAGMKKSLDGFDRRFSRRDIAVADGPTVDGDEIRVGWSVTYGMDGQPPFTLRGRSVVRYRGDQIASLVDSYDDAAVDADLTAWQRQTGIRLDPSYA
jgi:hypothetical protein